MNQTTRKIPILPCSGIYLVKQEGDTNRLPDASSYNLNLAF